MITNSLFKHYQEDVVPQLREKRGYKNAMEIPKLVKVVLNKTDVLNKRNNISRLNLF